MNLVSDPNDKSSVEKLDQDPLNFLNHQRVMPRKRSADQRKIDFKEIYNEAEGFQSANQASRCLDCGNPYCEWKCPLHNYIPNWLKSVSEERYQQAAEQMYETNPLPEICGRVCPQDRLCEQACTINTGFGAVTIGAIEKNISDLALAKKWRPDLSMLETSDRKVAIVGAGPAGLACADQLARNGIKAVVYDQYPEIGGLLTFGIPGFKLEKEVVRKRREFLQDIGVEFRLNTKVGEDVSFDQLSDNFDSIFLAMGTYNAVMADLPGNKLNGVIKALDFLIGNVNQTESYAMNDFPFHNLKDKQVVVLGGGDTAMDCVRTAVRQGATSVKCVYRRDQESMPGSPREVANAKEEGVEFLFNYAPLEIQSNHGKTVSGLKVIETQQQFDPATGKNKLIEVEGSEQVLPAETVITAFGFKASPAEWFEKAGIKTHDNGLVETKVSQESADHYLQQTSAANIYAGGDMVRGADLVVTAVAEGIKAAREIIAAAEL